MSRPFLLVLVLLTVLRFTAISQTFREFTDHLSATPDSSAKAVLIDRYLFDHQPPIVEDSCVHFLYRGKGCDIALPGEPNGWNPWTAPMLRIEGTNLFQRTDTLPLDSRVEYKIRVDSNWILDPSNPLKALGGFGWNSDLRMPGYRAYANDSIRTSRRGKIDTLWITSESLKRAYPVYVYIPPEGAGKNGDAHHLPAMYVTDGGDYLSFGSMAAILDELTGSKRIRPVVAIFIDPHTDPHDPSSDHRMTDYAASDAFLDFLQHELAPLIEKRYPVSSSSRDRLILGASMGGLISIYAVLRRPDFITLSAAQSPALLQADSAAIKLLGRLNTVAGDFYIQTGTIGDTQVEVGMVERLLREKGARVTLEEYHEGHNWTNWRTKLDRILIHFFPLTP